MKGKIEILPGSNLESVVYTLLAAKARGEFAYAEFNGHKLFSDTVSMDSAYMEITGQTKANFDRAQKELLIKEKNESKKKALEKIPTWIQKGQALIFPERYEEWEKCVSIRANDLNYGMELDVSLNIMESLEKGITLTEAKKMFDAQLLSGGSSLIVRDIIFIFSSRGPEFWEATAYDDISSRNKKLLETKKEENIQLAQVNAQKNSGPKL